MAYENVHLGGIPGLTAAADLSAKQFTFVSVSGAKAVNTPAKGALCVGVLQNKPTSGQAAALAINGDVTKLVAGTGGLTAGAKVATDADGTGIIAATGDYSLAICLEAAAAGELATVYLALGDITA